LGREWRITHGHEATMGGKKRDSYFIQGLTPVEQRGASLEGFSPESCRHSALTNVTVSRCRWTRTCTVVQSALFMTSVCVYCPIFGVLLAHALHVPFYIWQCISGRLPSNICIVAVTTAGTRRTRVCILSLNNTNLFSLGADFLPSTIVGMTSSVCGAHASRL
jgi:hypothetical protein